MQFDVILKATPRVKLNVQLNVRFLVNLKMIHNVKLNVQLNMQLNVQFYENLKWKEMVTEDRHFLFDIPISSFHLDDHISLFWFCFFFVCFFSHFNGNDKL